MSVDLLISPRVSFSHDVHLSEDDPSVPSEVDFDFAFSIDRQGVLVKESSTADELFSDGKLLPASVDNPELIHIPASPVFPCFNAKQGVKEVKKKKKILKSLKEHLEDDTDDDEEREDGSMASRTFWKFRRSSSVNVSIYGRKQRAPSKPKLLSRSKSTGLPGNTAEEEGTKPTLPTLMEDETSFCKFKRSRSLDCDRSSRNKGGLIGSLKLILLRSNSANEPTIRRSSSLNCEGHRSRGLTMGRSYSTGSAAYSEKRSNKQRRRRRSFKDYYEIFYSGERVNPVLNLPSPYISRASVDLMGFSSLFCSGRYRRKSK